MSARDTAQLELVAKVGFFARITCCNDDLGTPKAVSCLFPLEIVAYCFYSRE